MGWENVIPTNCSRNSSERVREREKRNLILPNAKYIHYGPKQMTRDNERWNGRTLNKFGQSGRTAKCIFKRPWLLLLLLSVHLYPARTDCKFLSLFIHSLSDRIKNFCGSIADSVTSKENVIHIRYYAEPQAVESKFEILYTAFRDKPIGQCKYLTEVHGPTTDRRDDGVVIGGCVARWSVVN